ncbi:MAG: DUF6249 domain-containing protein [Flavobacteriaceae bacterium]
MSEIFIPISFFLAVFAGLYVYLTTRNKERMAMIENGVDPSVFVKKRNNSRNGFTLKFGMLFVGVSLGILSGSLLSYSFEHEEVAYFSMILLFGGIALIANAILERKAQEKNQD